MSTRAIELLEARYHTKTAREQFGDIVLLISHQQEPHDVAIATLLAARTTDKQVAKVYPGFKRRFPHLKTIAAATVKEIEKEISTIGLYKQKARAIHGLAIKVLRDHDGNIPETMTELIELPGIGRKTASVILSMVFHKPAIAVDTHVYRVSRRMGWAKAQSINGVERELKARFPESWWMRLNQVLVPFGREFCQARTPRCWECPLRAECQYKQKTRQKGKR